MRFRELEAAVKQLLAGGGGGGGSAANPLNRIERKTQSDPMDPSHDDAAVLGMLALPNGSTFIATKSPATDTFVEVEVMISSGNNGYGVCTPMVHDPADPGSTTRTLDKVYMATTAEGMSMMTISPLSFIVPAGWEYTLMIETDGSNGSVNLQHLHETPLN